ncbi:MAG: lactate racemase domain-containing protein [Treponema sp.]|jgi:nickel-dependent lactate racemase|nr:lactate racemase domain-containing protein [Treponema sp.]
MEKTYIACGSADTDLCDRELEELFCGGLSQALADLNETGSVILLPPDITRFHSRAGFFTEIAARELVGRFGGRLGAILPALGTHVPMTDAELTRMFGNIPKEKFLVHDWRNDIIELGRLEASFVEKVSEGAVNYDWPAQVNKLLKKNSGNFSLAVSIGQVVPHEVAGMANHAKNIFVGTGGKEAIDKSHFVGAAYGMEKIMGQPDNPVRALFDEGLKRFGSMMPPILWVLTVIGARADGTLAVRGLFIGFGKECFEKAAALSREINVNQLKKSVNKAVVYLEPEEYRTTWLGNKAVYRTRMAIADGGELVILAPALERFGEDLGVDSLIRRYGYRPSAEIIAKVKSCAELSDNLSAAAHLIHGSSEGRFTVRYCAGDKVSKQEIESVGYQWGDLTETLRRYNPKSLTAGWNTLNDGEEIFYVPNPGLGLWAV